MKTLLILVFCYTALNATAYDPIYRPFGQDPYFVGTHNALLFLNPSFAGSNRGTRVQLSHRVFNGTWLHSYSALNTSIDMYLKRIKGAVFANWLLDDVHRGTLKTNFFSLGYAQHINLSKKARLIPSMQFSYLTRSLDITGLHFRQIPDARYGGNEIITALPQANKSNFDASTGLLLEAGNFYGGVSVMHLNQPDIGLLGENRLPIRTNLHASYNFHASGRSLLNLSARYSAQNEKYYGQLMATSVTFKHFITGAGIGLTGYDFINDYTPLLFNLGYRSNFITANFIYEYSTNYAGDGSYEIALSYNLRNKDSRRTLTNMEAW
jgi:type IX secretion system PorP/SprF family membrane protein